MIDNDAVIFGILILILGFVFYTSNLNNTIWKRFYTFFPVLLVCYFLPSLLNYLKLIDSSKRTGDPLWQLPLWDNYSNQLNSEHADFKNIGNSVFGGAITAALFLQKFVKNTPWIHIDLMAWTRANKYSSYEGGEAMGIRALLDFFKSF